MTVTTTTNTSFEFNCRPTEASSFNLTYTNESTNEATTVGLIGAAVADGKISFTASLGLLEDTMYYFVIDEAAGDEVTKQKVFVTDQSTATYKITEGEFTTAASGDNDFIIYE
jgi:hypothetical protein